MIKPVIFAVLAVIILSAPFNSYAADDFNALVRDKDFKKLEAMGAEAFDALMAILKSDISFDRAKAAELLGKIKDERAIDHIYSLTNDKSELVSKKALQALNNITGEKIGADDEEIQAWWDNYNASKAPAPPKGPERRPLLRTKEQIAEEALRQKEIESQKKLGESDPETGKEQVK